ncbi:hypothetical protein AVEN_235264-1 [Araneus ventricosus]|uniref:Uncharacterized protein n=1 Tax=Araneus ventricosus TaxID=182803 RepID=A0A4Y2A5P9_ARAVE|nr:hypothetical protein AVEN_235264-1 [Araneus ventricosus]
MCLAQHSQIWLLYQKTQHNQPTNLLKFRCDIICSWPDSLSNSSIDPTNLSCNQKYSFGIFTAISSGVGSSDLAKREPEFTHPSWFRIEVHYSITDVARHLWHFISSSRYLPKKYRDIIEPVISRNAYFAAPENMLLAMLKDERYHIRTLAARPIINAREIGPDGEYIRRFVIPAVNFQATD